MSLAGILFLLGSAASTWAHEWKGSYLPVPIVRQSLPYSCGAAALLSVATYWNKFEGDETELIEKLKTSPQHGTPPENILAAARELGLTAHLQEGMSFAHLRAALAVGTTVILDIQAWPNGPGKVDWRSEWESGHYAVLIGMDQRRAYFMDPSTLQGYTYIPLKELAQRWHDYEWVAGKKRIYYRAGIVIRGTEAIPAQCSRFLKME